MAEVAPLHGIPCESLPDQYIVVLKETATDADKSDHRQLLAEKGCPVLSELSIINGYYAKLTDEVVCWVRQHPSTKYIEYNQEAKASAGAGMGI